MDMGGAATGQADTTKASLHTTLSEDIPMNRGDQVRVVTSETGDPPVGSTAVVEDVVGQWAYVWLDKRTKAWGWWFHERQLEVT